MPELHALPITDSRRDYLNKLRALSFDTEGNEVLVGLDREESVFYVGYAEKKIEGLASGSGGAKYLDLHAKHEKSRLAVLGSEVQLRETKPPIH